MAKKTTNPDRTIAPNNLKAALRAAGRTQEWLAAALGVHFQTINRWANAQTDLTWTQAVQIAEKLHVDPLAVFAPIPMTRRVTVCGALQAGLWTRSFDWPDDECYEIGIPDEPRYASATLYGAEIRGESMNLVYPDRSVVVLERGVFGPRDLTAGARYHVEMQRRDGSVENTLKGVRASGDGSIWLVPESSDPAFQAPVKAVSGDGEHISIVGRVISSYRPE